MNLSGFSVFIGEVIIVMSTDFFFHLILSLSLLSDMSVMQALDHHSQSHTLFTFLFPFQDL